MPVATSVNRWLRRLMTVLLALSALGTLVSFVSYPYAWVVVFGFSTLALSVVLAYVSARDFWQARRRRTQAALPVPETR